MGLVPRSEWPVPEEWILCGLRVFDIGLFLGKGGLQMIILCHLYHFDDSKTTFSGKIVLLYLGLVAKQTLWGDQNL